MGFQKFRVEMGATWRRKYFRLRIPPYSIHDLSDDDLFINYGFCLGNENSCICFQLGDIEDLLKNNYAIPDIRGQLGPDLEPVRCGAIFPVRLKFDPCLTIHPAVSV